jgi:hypothetical protein
MRALLCATALSAASLSCAMPSAPPAEGRGNEAPGPSRRDPVATEAAPPGPAAATGEDPGPVPWKATPVVVELFSSEGCSSCPPADVVLRGLVEQQPVPGAEILALEMHVDYWDDLGWPDPFSSDVYTSRQRAYTRALGDRSMYTPQMVVDGVAGFVGSNAAAARRAIERAARAPKAKVTLARSGDTLSITVSDVPAPAPEATVTLALVEEGLASDVKRGENAGSMLAHGPVVRALKKLGSIAAGAKDRAFEASEVVALPPSWRRDRVRAVVLVQAAESLAILGAAAASMK